MSAINELSDRGMFFWDYGNAFLLEASRAGNVLVPASVASAATLLIKPPSHLQGYDVRLQVMMEDYQNGSVLCCLRQLCTMIRTSHT